MEAGRSEKKQTGSDKVTTQKKWADAHQRAETVCGESGLQDKASQSRSAGLLLLQLLLLQIPLLQYLGLLSYNIKYTQV